MIYTFTDTKGTFRVNDPAQFNAYFPLTNKEGTILSAITPRLSGDIKKDNEHFLTVPASMEDLRANLLCRREVFLTLDKRILRLSEPWEGDILEAGLLFHQLIKNRDGLKITITNFVPFDQDFETMQINISNTTSADLQFTATSCLPLYGRSEKNLRDHRHVSSLLNRLELDNGSIVLTPTMIFNEKHHTKNTMSYYALGFQDNGIKPLGQFPTLDYFCGQGDMLAPDAINKKVLPVSAHIPDFDGKEACAAFAFNPITLKPGQSTTFVLITGIAENRQEIRDVTREFNDISKITQSLAKTKEFWQTLLSSVEVDFKDTSLNGWLLWAKFQPTLRRLFGCSFLPHFDYGKGGRGWRDLWQDALTLLMTEPEKAKQLLLESFKGVRIDGTNATIIGSGGSFLADRNKISRVWMDHGVWPYLTTASYIHKSGDTKILLKETTYFYDHQLKRAQAVDKHFNQKDFLLRVKNKVYKGSILEHLLIENLVQFFNVGSHNAIRLENADWNDGLDMAAPHGESVAFSFMYAHNLRDICVFLRELRKRSSNIKLCKELLLLIDTVSKPIEYNNYKEKQTRLDLYLEKVTRPSGRKVTISIDKLILDLEKKSTHLFAWLSKKEMLPQGFMNGYYDNSGTKVEGAKHGSLTMFLPSQVFAIMSGGLNKSQIQSIWDAIDIYLKDKKHGGVRLNTNLKDIQLNLGRAYGFSYGDKENGAFFSHMSVMLSFALYKQGFIKQGFEVLDSLYSMATNESSSIYPGIPEYFNNQGRGLYLYLTGSASWYNYTLLRQVIGVDFYLGDLLINPKLMPPNFKTDSIEVRFKLNNKLITLLLHKKGSSTPLVLKQVLFQKTPVAARNGLFLIARSSIIKETSENISIEGFLE